MYKNVCYSKSISFTSIKDELFIFEEKNDKIFILRGFEKEFFLNIKEKDFINSEFYKKIDKKYIEKILSNLKKNKIIEVGENNQ